MATTAAAGKEFELFVESILGSFQLEDGQQLYHVKWQTSWLSESILVSKYPNLIKGYWEKVHNEEQSADKSHENISKRSETKINYSSVSMRNENHISCTSTKVGIELHNTEIENEKNENLKNADDFVNQDVPDQNKLEIKKVKCPHCGKWLSCQRVLKRHITLRHLKNGRFECPKCSKRFFQRMELERHMTVHTNIRRHTCELCGKSFKQSGHLSQHMKIHTGDKPFPCGLCAEKFRSKENLESHQSTHGNAKSFKCNQCSSTFKHKTSIYSHVKRVHGSESRDIICDGCDAGFCSNAKLKKHKKICV